MAVGFPTKADYATGDVLTAANMNDLAGTLNTVNAPLGNAAGKNKIINGDFGIWQRGTSINIASNAYWADRFSMDMVAATPTGTASRQAFTPGAAPVAGYESNFFGRLNITAHNNATTMYAFQRIENVTTFANQSITVSLYMKADAAVSMGVRLVQNFGSGGSGAVVTTLTSSPASVTTSWARYTFTATVPSISGKTIGTGSSLEIRLDLPTSGGFVRVGTYDYWGLQVEAGSTATPFQTASGTIQGELAACQRYYHRVTVGGASNTLGVGLCDSTTSALVSNSFPVAMRIAPTALEQSGSAADYLIRITGGTGVTVTAVPTFSAATTVSSIVTLTAASGLTGGQAAFCRAANANAYFGWSAEL